MHKYMAIVTVETPMSSVTKSTKVPRISLSEQIAVIGGTLGLFTGMSILSMAEILCFFFKFTKKLCLFGANKLIWKKKSTVLDQEELKEDSENSAKLFVAELIQRASSNKITSHGLLDQSKMEQSKGLVGDAYLAMKKSLYISRTGLEPSLPVV